MHAEELTISKLLTEQSAWTVETITARHARLLALAKRTWVID